MAIYLQLARYNADGARTVMEDGLTARRAAIEEMLSALGGQMLGYYAVTDGNWHVAALVQLPDELSHADLGRIQLMQASTGRVEKLSLLSLATPEAFDAASRVAERSYRAPGQT